jgi:hypothetical protein
MWDPDYYYDLKDKLEEVLKLLEDNPITDKPGICSLIDEYSEDYE